MFKVVISTVEGMGTLTAKKRSESGGDGAVTGDGDDASYSAAWLSPNGDGGQDPQQQQQQPGPGEVSVEAEDTPFLKELRARAKVS